MLILVFLTAVICCEFHQDDHYYNLTHLSRPEPYTVKVSADSSFFKMAYQFNFCGNHPKHCQGQSGAYEMIEVMGMLTDSCEMIGKPEQEQISPIENGLQITYSQGSVCENNQKRTVNFKVYCSSQADANFVQDSADKCNTVFSIKSPAGCKMQNQSIPYFIYYLSGTGLVLMLVGIYFTYKQVNKKEKIEGPYEQLKPDQLNPKPDVNKEEAST